MSTTEANFLTETCVEQDGLSVAVFAQPAVNLALVHNGVPVVQAIRVRNTGTVPQVDVTITVTLHRDGELLADAWTRTHEGDLAPGAEAIWTDFASVHPSYAHLSALNESHPAVLRVLVSRTWGEECQLTLPVRVLAHNEWFNAPVFYASLAAFVQPNTRAVQSILIVAAEVLRKATGDASLGGYQAGPERAALIAAAVYEALRQRNIRYIEPPASFEQTGQKVRSTSQVIHDRLGTCVDLSVTYAACLEQAGLRPLIWIVDGHAFAGFMRDDETAVSASVLDEPNAMTNLVRSGRAVVLEAAFYGSEPENVFAGAIRTAYKRFEHPELLRAVIAVSAVRREGVRPLPSLDQIEPEVEETGQEAEAVVNPLALPAELRQTFSDDDVVVDSRDDAPARVRKWKNALLDLSTRNRLLNLRPSAQVIDLELPAGTLPALDDMVHAGSAVRLRPQDDLGDLASLQGVRRAQDADPEALRKLLLVDHTVHARITTNRYQSGLRSLQRAARTLLEETGNANLYLAFGSLVHRTSGGKEARAPLFLVPAKLEGGTGRSEFRVTVDPSNTAAPNYCLVEWLRIKHDVRIAELEEPRLDDSGLDIPHALRGIRAALVDHRLDFRIDETASLAICQFSTFGMWRDLDVHWDELSRSPVVQHLALHPGESFRDPAADGAEGSIDELKIDDAAIAVPIPADGSQLKAVALAAAGRTFVLEGPPGTGKSQTITNLVAHALANGKTVLFVAEKQAALEVVKRRLEAVGLGPFALDLHGRDQQPKLIREQLKTAMDHAVGYERRRWRAAQARFRSRHVPLDEYPRKVHRRNGFDYSLWSAAESIQQLGPGAVADIPTLFVDGSAASSEQILDALESFARASRGKELGARVPWALVGTPDATLDPDTASRASQSLELALAEIAADHHAESFVALASSLDELRALIDVLDRRAGADALPSDELERVRGEQWRRDRESLRVELQRLTEEHAEVLRVFRPAVLVDADLATFTSLADGAQSGVFRKQRQRRFASAAEAVSTDGEVIEPTDAQRLAFELTAARERASRLNAEALALTGGRLSHQWSALRNDDRAHLTATLEAFDEELAFSDEYPVLSRNLRDHGAVSSATMETLNAFVQAAAEWRRLLGSGDEAYERWRDGRPWFTAWQATAPIWSAAVRDGGDVPIQRWAQMVGCLDELRTSGLTDFREQLLAAEIAADDAPEAFLRGTARASIRERRGTAGLDVFEPAVHDGHIEDFANAADALRVEQRHALPAALLAERSFQAGHLDERAGALRRKLDAKRNAVSFRHLMDEYADLIMEATPCVFVSPASLAQFIPPGAATFDLVVFDEASQVTVPQAIGALGRARSAVIVGDSQQMPPTAVGKTSASSDEGAPEEGQPIEDLESILTECVESGFPRLWLSWHYRSQHESLIAFSNRHYYDGQLASLPSPGGDPTAGVEWRRVDGHFNREDKGRDHRTNRVEAEAIVEEIRARLADPLLSRYSMGVVTFNSQQRDLVLNLLEDTGDPLVLAKLRPDVDEGLFVKNLENVQGDERDVILFSAAFSRKADSSALPLNFGPLSNQGGEKRLNVAVTRARRKVLMFTSFDPTDIDLARTASRGMADLRAYIEMASRPVGGGGVSKTALGRDEIAAAIERGLVERGLIAEPDFGLSEFSLDLVVREPDSSRWQVAVVLDGPAWASRATASDRDLMPRLLVDIMSWGAVVRVWLPEWLDAPEAVLDRIQEALDQAKEREEAARAELEAAAAEQAKELARLQATHNADAESDGVAAEAVVDSAPTAGADASESWQPGPPSEVPVPGGLVRLASLTAMTDVHVAEVVRDFDAVGESYVEEPAARLGGRADLDRTNSREIRSIIAEALRRTVEREGPIESNRLAREIAKRFGFDRVPAARAEFILSVVPEGLTHTSDLGSFVWPTQLNRGLWRGFRTTPDGVKRPISEIAPEEIINAMAAVAASGHISDRESLFRETLALFRQKKLTSASAERLEMCLRLALTTGRLTDDGDRFREGA